MLSIGTMAQKKIYGWNRNDVIGKKCIPIASYGFGQYETCFGKKLKEKDHGSVNYNK
jgi:hypothetical protein